jgi:hypothetical protein
LFEFEGHDMSLRILTRKTKVQLFSVDQDVSELLFSQKRAQHACRLFLEFLKEHHGLTRAELNRFSWDLQAGNIEKGFGYSRTRFYVQIRRTLLTLGLVAIEQRFIDSSQQDLMPERRYYRQVVEKYVAVRQPIPKRPPDGLNLPRLMWNLCKVWNDEFLSSRQGDEDLEKEEI